MNKVRVNDLHQIFHEESFTGDFFVHALNSSQNLICVVKLSTDVEAHKTIMTIYHFNNAFEKVVGPFTKLKGQDLRNYLKVDNLFSSTEWISAENIQGQKLSAQLHTHWNEIFDVHVSWNLFEFENSAYLFFVFDNFPLPEREHDSNESLGASYHLPDDFKDKQFFSLKRMINMAKSQFLNNYPEAPEFQIKIDELLPDQIFASEAALYSAFNAVFDLFNQSKITKPVRVSLSPHPDKPRMARFLIRTADYVPTLKSMDFYSEAFKAIGGDFTTECYEGADSSIYISLPFDLVTGEIPSSPVPEEKLPRMVPIGLKVAFILNNPTNKIILEHFLDEVHVKAFFEEHEEKVVTQTEKIRPDIIILEVDPQKPEMSYELIEKIRVIESSYTAQKSAIIAIMPDTCTEFQKQRLIDAGANAWLPESYNRKNLLEALIHFAPFV